MNKTIRILTQSDQHNGHRRISPMAMALNSAAYFLPLFEKTDLLVLGGDFFETMVDLEGSNVIVSSIIDILKEAEKHNIIVRVLRGTFSHDRNQCLIFKTLHEKAKLKNSLKYFSVMSAEYIEELDLKVLYIPDDLPYKSADEVMDAIYQILRDMGWDKFDYVFGHGNFKHMFPDNIPHLPKITFEKTTFEKIVARLAVFGHIHQHSKNGKIAYNGSFERLQHGEEEKKGCLYIVDDGKNQKIEFVENKGATKFLTWNLSKYDISEVVDIYRKKLEPYKNEHEIHIRVQHPSSEVRVLLSKISKQHHKNVVYTPMSTEDKQAHVLKSHKLVDVEDQPTPAPENLASMVYDHLHNIYGDPIPLSVIAATLNANIASRVIP